MALFVVSPNRTGPVWLSNVLCSGGEGRLIDCSAAILDEVMCLSESDAGVQCGKSNN